MKNDKILETLYLQLDTFIDKQTARLKGIKQPTNTDSLLKRSGKFKREFLKGFIKERASRSEELNSSEVTLANKKALQLMGDRPGIMSCMDSRLPVTIMFGLPMQAAKSMRLPGGDMPGFFFDASRGRLSIDKTSRLASLLKPNRNDSPAPRFQILVCHTGCAARFGLEQLAGRNPSDQGLYADVYSKNEQGKVLQKEYNIEPIGFVYDVGTGYGFMGLSRDDVLSQAREFDTPLLAQLEEENKIINTKSVALKYREVFQKNFFTVDWTSNHKETALRFMIAMENIAEAIQSEVIKQVKALYPNRSAEELRIRSMLILFNAFSGFLHDPEGKGNPYSLHQEVCVVFDYKSKGPFKEYPAFALAPIRGNVAEYAQLAQTIVRDNRRAGRVSDNTKTYLNESFIAATVPVVYKAEVRIPSSDEVWNLIRNIDWSDIAYTWQDEHLAQWLSLQIGSKITQEKFIKFVTVLDEMKSRLHELKTNAKTQSLLDSDSICILPLLVSSDRQPQAIVPFVA